MLPCRHRSCRWNYQGGSTRELAVAGDTVSDVESGLPGTPLILESVAGLLPHLLG